MKIDLHIHTKDGSDGHLSIEEVFSEAHKRCIGLISITDHDSIDVQERAKKLADQYGMRFLSGVELNVTFSHPEYKDGKEISLDFLGYNFDIHNENLGKKLAELRAYRVRRAEIILDNINEEFEKQGLPLFTPKDLEAIQASADGAFGRPHIANYLIEKGLVKDKQEAFDKYLIKSNVPKMPLSLTDASSLIRGAGGKLVIAHPNDPNNTSLVSLSHSLLEQQKIIEESMLGSIDGVECWHSRHDQETIASYLKFVKRHSLIVTGGSDCHQQPILIGMLDIPDYVASQFGF